MATSPQWSPLYNSNSPPICVPICQNNLSTTAIFFIDWWKSQEWSWNLTHMVCSWLIVVLIVSWFCAIQTAAVNINWPILTLSFNTFFQHKVFCVFYLYIVITCDWITIMRYSKHELSTINILYPPKQLLHYPCTSHKGHLSTMATFFCPQGGCYGEVWL